MSFEAAFLLAYANLLLLAALGLHRLGRVNPSPWRSRVLAGHRRRHPEGAPAEPPAGLGQGGGAVTDGWPPGWPRAGQRRLHSGMALVAATAATVLAAAGACRHHRRPELVLLILTGAAACAVLVRLARALTRDRELARAGAQR